MAMHLKTACKKNSKQKQHTIRMKETKLEQETKSGAGESTETRRIPLFSATPGAEAEREGEADRREVRAGPRSGRRVGEVDD